MELEPQKLGIGCSVNPLLPLLVQSVGDNARNETTFYPINLGSRFGVDRILNSFCVKSGRSLRLPKKCQTSLRCC